MPDADTLDELCLALGRLRAEAGSPSYAEIARRIGALRGGAEPAKVTVYDCFRPGRRRVDDRLVGDIARALGASPRDADAWRERARVLNGERTGVHLEASYEVRDAGHVVGRDRLVSGIGPADVVVLTGLPGVGKSTVASALAAAWADGPVLTVRLREREPGRAVAGSVDVLRRLLGALGHRSVPYDLARLRERFAAEARGRLVVVEDAASVERLAALLVPGVRYVVTTRGDLTGLDRQPAALALGIRHVTVPPLDDDASLALLRSLTGRDADGSDTDDRGAGDPDALRRIADVGAGLPLDLVMLAGAVNEAEGWPLDDLAARIEREPRGSRIRGVLDASVRSLGPEEAELLGDIALVDAETHADTLLSAAGPSAADALRRLAARHLAEHADGRIRLHATVFAFVRERTLAERPLSARRAVVERIASAALERIGAERDYAVREIGTVLAVAAAVREHGLGALGERIAIAAHPELSRWSMWAETLRLHDLAASADGLDLIPELALGIALSAEKLGRYDEALMTLHRVRRVARGVPLARTWNQIGNVERWMSRFDDALASYGHAIAIAEAEQDAVVLGRALGNRADTLRILARYAEAETGYAEALAVSLTVDDELNLAIVRGNRGLLHTSTGRLDEAEEELGGMLAAAPDEPQQNVRLALALLAEAAGDDALALERATDALEVARRTGEYSISADLRLLVARVDGRAGHVSRARDAAAEAFSAAERAGSPLMATEAANSLAEILLGDARPDGAEARRLATEAAGIAEATGDRAEHARSLGILSRVAALGGDAAESERLAEASAALYRDIGHRLARG